MKKITISIIFIIFICLIILKTEQIIRGKIYAYNVSQFYNEPENIDVFFIGSSRIYYPMSPMYIWNTYGITSYNRGSSGQYYKLTYLFTEEIIKKYKPKLLIIDILYLESLAFEGPNRVDISLANMENSLFKLNSYKYIYNTWYDSTEHINTYNRFHTRWKELNKYDFKTDSFWKGQYTGTFINIYWDKLHLITPQKRTTTNINNDIQLNPETIKYANKIFELTKKNNISILFIKIPNPTNNFSAFDIAFAKLAKEKNWNFINYNNLIDQLNINYDTDFRDISHLNLYGSRKLMDHLIPYIIEKYNIPNRKNDPEFASWNEDYKKYERAINREEIREIKDFDKWFNLAMYQDYIITIASRNGLPKNIDKNLFNYLDRLRLSKIKEYKPKDNYIAIIDDKKVFDEQIGKNNLSFKGRMKRIVNLNIFSSINKADIFISGTNRSKNSNGLNFVIYDKINREIVDSIWINPTNSSKVNR